MLEFIPFETNFSQVITEQDLPNFEIKCQCCNEMKKQSDTGVVRITNDSNIYICKDCSKDLTKVKATYTQKVLSELKELNLKRYLRGYK